MNVLSLFDGISCGMIALERAGIKVDNYFASEVDENAITVSNHNYPNIVRLGDVNNWRKWDLPKIDLVIGGSPCQGFSICGKQLALEDPRSKLFLVFVDILRTIKCYNPKVKFMLENVGMKKQHLDVITEMLNVKPVTINSKLVSAQMRKRHYWANFKITQPKDKNIKLKDIITNGFVEKDKSWCVLESWNRFPRSTESAKGRYKRSMMPIVFDDESYNFDLGWRELDIFEVEQLQTVPAGYCRSVSDKKAKGLLGNGWTVEVIAHIFKGMNNEKT